MAKPKRLSHTVFIRHIKDIKLADFITAHCSGDLSVLIIKGKPTQEELELAWKELYEQYIKAIAKAEYKDRVQLVRDYSILEFKIKRGYMLLDLYGIHGAEKVIIDLINGFGYPIPKATKDNLKTVLKAFQSYIKRDIVTLNQLSNSLKTKEAKEEVATEDNYYQMLVGIAETLKVVVNPNDISVAYYCALVNQYSRHVEQLIKQQNK